MSALSSIYPRPREIAPIVQSALADLQVPDFPCTLRFWDGSTLGESGPVVHVRDRSAVAHLLHAPGQMGLARAWVTGAIDVDGDVQAILRERNRFADVHVGSRARARLLAAAVRVLGPGVLRRPPVPDIEARSRGRLHSLSRDKAAISHHYDVSNDFYRLLLGPTMVYSCAYFAGSDDTLETAQRRKLELICDKLQLAPDERLLDIGCGWGALLIHAARHHGVRGLGVTLSKAQAQLARERIAAAGLADRIEVRVLDYRELTGATFDKIASVGMYEHVGRGELDRYARAVHALLRPGGLFLNHGIARLHSEPPTADTFLTRYVFPDGALHPVSDVLAAMQGAGLEPRDVESLREHYPLTLARWVENLDARLEDAVREVGEARVRVWRLYMLGSALAFEDADNSVYQVLAARAGAPHSLPLRRGSV